MSIPSSSPQAQDQLAVQALLLPPGLRQQGHEGPFSRGADGRFRAQDGVDAAACGNRVGDANLPGDLTFKFSRTVPLQLRLPLCPFSLDLQRRRAERLQIRSGMDGICQVRITATINLVHRSFWHILFSLSILQIPFFVSDVPDGFHVDGPRQAEERSQIKLKCSASKSDYANITWFKHDASRGDLQLVGGRSKGERERDGLGDFRIDYLSTKWSHTKQLR